MVSFLIRICDIYGRLFALYTDVLVSVFENMDLLCS